MPATLNKLKLEIKTNTKEKRNKQVTSWKCAAICAKNVAFYCRFKGKLDSPHLTSTKAETHKAIAVINKIKDTIISFVFLKLFIVDFVNMRSTVSAKLFEQLKLEIKLQNNKHRETTHHILSDYLSPLI